MLTEAIGEPAMLEQVAEECSELSFACLKLARHYRGDNKVHGRTEIEMHQNLTEEVADICVCIHELIDGGLVDPVEVVREVDFKRKRMKRRLAEDN